jgi:hypothetical protein
VPDVVKPVETKSGGNVRLPRRVLNDHTISPEAKVGFCILLDCERNNEVRISDRRLGERLRNDSGGRYKGDSPEVARRVITELTGGEHIEAADKNGQGRTPTYRILYHIPTGKYTARERNVGDGNIPLRNPQHTAPRPQTYRSGAEYPNYNSRYNSRDNQSWTERVSAKLLNTPEVASGFEPDSWQADIIAEVRRLGPLRLGDLHSTGDDLFLGMIFALRFGGEDDDEDANLALADEIATQLTERLDDEKSGEAWGNTQVVEFLDHCHKKTQELGKGWNELSKIELDIVDLPF